MLAESFSDKKGAVVDSGAVGENCLAMSAGAIAFVVAPIVVRELGVELAHELVSGDFGDNTGGGDGVTELVAFGDGGDLVGRNGC